MTLKQEQDLINYGKLFSSIAVGPVFATGQALSTQPKGVEKILKSMATSHHSGQGWVDGFTHLQE